MKKGLALAAVVVATAAVIMFLRTEGRAGQAKSSMPRAAAPLPKIVEDDPVERMHVPVTLAQPQRGSASAPVTIVAFSDFECPFCGRVLPSLREVEQIYGDKVRIVWRNQPLAFHPHAQPAAEAAMEAFAQGQDAKFWAMHDKLFEHRDALARADLERYASELGLNTEKFKAALDSHKHESAIKADSHLGTIVGARGTPVFFINGRQLAGAKPTIAFKELIDDELKRVDKLKAKNVPAERVYETLMANAKKVVAPGPQKSVVPQTIYHVPVSARDPQQGAEDALVTVVMFGDFQDKFSQKAAATLRALLPKYGSDLRIVWKNVPLAFHEDAKHAATVAIEAFEQGGNERFWQAHQLLFENMSELGRAALENYGEQLGLPPKKLKAALNHDSHKAKIDEDLALVPRLWPVYTTPLLTINGRFIRGSQESVIYEATIGEELEKAKSKVASGIMKAALYEEIIKDGRTEPAELPAASGKVYDVAVPADAPSLGGSKAKVVLQEFSDFQCPFCVRAQPTLKALSQEYKDRIRIVWRDYPLPMHADAPLAAQAAREVFVQGKSGKFWAYHDLLFANQSALSRADLEKYAEQVGGINMKKFRAALDNKTHEVRVQADMTAYATSGASLGTPGFFINGKLVAGAQPIEVFRSIIDKELQAK